MNLVVGLSGFTDFVFCFLPLQLIFSFVIAIDVLYFAPIELNHRMSACLWVYIGLRFALLLFYIKNWRMLNCYFAAACFGDLMLGRGLEFLPLVFTLAVIFLCS